MNLQTFNVTVKNDIDFESQVLNKVIILSKDGKIEAMNG